MVAVMTCYVQPRWLTPAPWQGLRPAPRMPFPALPCEELGTAWAHSQGSAVTITACLLL